MATTTPVTITAKTITADIDQQTMAIAAVVAQRDVVVDAQVSMGIRGERGERGDQRVFVQDAAPDFNGLSGLWMQTGINGDGMTLWVEDGLS